jgi:hypothetical protein
VEISSEGEDNISTGMQISPSKDPKSTLKLVIVEIFSILNGWMDTTSSYKQLAIILQF